jgi:hypothetical protein
MNVGFGVYRCEALLLQTDVECLGSSCCRSGRWCCATLMLVFVQSRCEPTPVPFITSYDYISRVVMSVVLDTLASRSVGQGCGDGRCISQVGCTCWQCLRSAILSSNSLESYFEYSKCSKTVVPSSIAEVLLLHRVFAFILPCGRRRSFGGYTTLPALSSLASVLRRSRMWFASMVSCSHRGRVLIAADGCGDG